MAAPPANGRRRLIVSAADAGYFPLLRGLLRSLRDRGAMQGADVAVLDLGLAADQRGMLERAKIQVVDAAWGFVFPLRARLEVERPWFRAMTSRPLLPSLLPGYDTYLWIDADAWVQTDDVVDLFFRCAAGDALAAIMSNDRSYEPLRDGRLWQWNARNFRAIAPEHADALCARPMINSGAFAMNASSPLWQAWAEALRVALVRQTDDSAATFMIEQIALNVAVLTSGAPFRPLPSRCNWLCPLAPPVWDPERALLCDPLAPHEPLGLIHLADRTKSGPQTIRGLDRITRTIDLRYPPRIVAPPADGASP